MRKEPPFNFRDERCMANFDSSVGKEEGGLLEQRKGKKIGCITIGENLSNETQREELKGQLPTLRRIKPEDHNPFHHGAPGFGRNNREVLLRR